MLRWLAALLAALSTLGAQAETYVYTGAYYGAAGGTILNDTTCASPHECGTFINTQRVTGYFTTAGPLGNNLVNANIIPSITGYWFNNGVSTISSGSASRIFTFRVSTDGAGAITSAEVELVRWTYSALNSPPAGPHGEGDEFDLIYISPASTSSAFITLWCPAANIGPSPDGTPDVCLAAGSSTATSSAGVPGGTWGAAPTVSIDSVGVVEGNAGVTVMNFTVTLSAVPTTPVSVAVAHTPVTATAGAGGDYVLALPGLSWAPGDPVTKTLPVVVQGDTTVEPDETFQITLSNPVGATLGTALGTGTILNDDGLAPAAAATAIPTLSEWALALLALASAALGMRHIRRLRRS